MMEGEGMADGSVTVCPIFDASVLAVHGGIELAEESDNTSVLRGLRPTVHVGC